MNETIHIPEIFGCDVFNESTMKQRLSKDIYNSWKLCIQNGTPLQLDVANEIAEAMKNWAIEKGATAVMLDMSADLKNIKIPLLKSI